MRKRHFFVLGPALIAVLSGCQSASTKPLLVEKPPEPITKPISEVVEIPVVVQRTKKPGIPAGQRIVIAEIRGNCGEQVKDALMQRLVENADYNVLSRDNLQTIIDEVDKGFGGRFDTTTTARAGEFLGASHFIIGNVLRCGRVLPVTRTVKDPENPEQDLEVQVPVWEILAVVQVLDLAKGEVLVASSSLGRFEPSIQTRIVKASEEEPGSIRKDTDSKKTRKAENAKKDQSKEEGQLSKDDDDKKQLTAESGSETNEAIENELDAIQEQENYPELRAAADLADDFAVRFFSRPAWENVKMFNNPNWHFGRRSIRLVKLGHCPTAVQAIQEISSKEMYGMPESDIAEYLHNFGVALLCANQPQRAMDKLRAAFRLTYDPATQAMLSLSNKVVEWSLEVQVDQEPEIEYLVERQ